MKSKKIQFLEYILRLMVRLVLIKYKPKIIGITGSVGKTSAKEAVYAVISKRFSVRKNEKNYNNEIGIPLTIIGAETGGRSIGKWLLIGFKWLRMVVWRGSYPEILILELGVDRPGDMEYLLSFVKPDIGIVTNISSSHIEFFGSLEGIAEEKGKLIESLGSEGFAILNADDELVSKMAQRTKSQVIMFGFSGAAKVHADRISYLYDEKGKPEGLSFKLSNDGSSLPIRLRHVLAAHQVNAALAGISAGIALKINLVDCAQGLESLTLPLGRLNIIEGIKNSIIIDDTYNASPTSTSAAIDVLGELKAKRKVVVLGDMLELGSEMEKGHLEIAKKIEEIDVDIALFVGKRMALAYEYFRNKKQSQLETYHFSDPMSAGLKVQEIIKEGDVVLIKGSQGMRMEKVVEEIIAQPQKASELICRQSDDWKKKPFIEP